MPLLSIIVPVYNVENYLNECLDSIINQGFHDYEIILVDDMSTDSSSKICDEYALKYNNIKVIHLTAKALPSGARNIGLDHSIGEYVHFCDSDDYYIKNSLSLIAENLKMKKTDVLIGQFECEPEKGAFTCNDIKLDFQVFFNNNPDDILNYFMRLKNLTYTPWRFIVNRKFLIQNNVRFLEGYHVEDEEWFPKIICIASKFSLLSQPFYCYRPRAIGSITSQKTYLHTKAHIVIAIKLLHFLKVKKYRGIRKEYIISRTKFLLGLFATRCDTLTGSQLDEIAEIIKSNIEVFDMLDEISQLGDLFDFLHRYGVYIGLVLYKAYVGEKTLEIVKEMKDKDIYIFPTGYNGEATERILKNAGYKIKGFLDNSDTKNGCIIDGIKVNHPSIIHLFNSEQLSRIFVVITTQYEDTLEILKDQLCSLGLVASQFDNRIY